MASAPCVTPAPMCHSRHPSVIPTTLLSFPRKRESGETEIRLLEEKAGVSVFRPPDVMARRRDLCRVGWSALVGQSLSLRHL
jgi:hypothetical protein